MPMYAEKRKPPGLGGSGYNNISALHLGYPGSLPAAMISPTARIGLTGTPTRLSRVINAISWLFKSTNSVNDLLVPQS